MLENDNQNVFNWDANPTLEQTRQFLAANEPADVTTTVKNTRFDPSNNHVVDSPVDKPGESTQLTLTEPLLECRLGWVYDDKREVNKRTGQPLKKKPSYRFARYNTYYLGRLTDNIAGHGLNNFDYTLNHKSLRNCVVFVPEELWNRYPDSHSWTKPHGPTLLDNVPTKHEQHNYLDGNLSEYITNITPAEIDYSLRPYETESTDWNMILAQQIAAIEAKRNSELAASNVSVASNTLVDTPSGPTHIDKPGFFRKIWNWINA